MLEASRCRIVGIVATPADAHDFLSRADDQNSADVVVVDAKLKLKGLTLVLVHAARLPELAKNAMAGEALSKDAAAEDVEPNGSRYKGNAHLKTVGSRVPVPLSLQLRRLQRDEASLGARRRQRLAVRVVAHDRTFPIRSRPKRS